MPNKKIKGGEKKMEETMQKTIRKCECSRCGYQWESQLENSPVYCPKCKSPYWNKPRINPSNKQK